MSKFEVPLVISSSKLTITEFWNAVMVYHSRPHLVNKKILAASQILFYNANSPNSDISQLSEMFTKFAVLYEMRQLKAIAKENITEQFIRNIVECSYKNLSLSESNEDEFKQKNFGFYISLRILLSRNKRSDVSVEIVLLNKNRNNAHFLAVTELDKFPSAPLFPYEIQLDDNFNLRINLNDFEDADTASAEWLASNLFPKLLKWSKQDENASIRSLSLISVDNYSLVYNRLKNSFADELIKKWPSKMTTDPQKHVFEDIAIASYLICLWKQYNIIDINFVDCGCGNGLLVYLLNKEGYKGYGIDVRSRPIWDIYGQDVVLKVDTITPDTTFSSSTWIIGNHSDELTPWIPVMALKSSVKTNFFVLPCCPYDFSGKKYIRVNTAISQYTEYIDYIEKLCKKCRFDTKTDKLRIPSTKKVCFVGFANNISLDLRQSTIKDIDEFIQKRSANIFSARSNVEQVRNCTQLNKTLLQRIIFAIVNLLLSSKNVITKSNGEEWNRGTSLSILSICQNLSQDDLKKLKNECGGVQTLLKNHRYLFFVEKGIVKLRLPYKISEVGDKYRTKPCWYFRNHDKGCLLSSEECAYMHNN